MSARNEVLLENLKADLRSRDWKYDSKCHSGRTASSWEVRSKV
jgi:hypothetical protein